MTPKPLYISNDDVFVRERERERERERDREKQFCGPKTKLAITELASSL